MTMLRSNFTDALTPGLYEVFFDAFGRKETVYDKVFNLKTSNKRRETDSYVSGFGIMPKKNESSDIAYDDPYQGYDTTYTNTTYGMAYRVSEEMIEDELYDVVDDMTTALALSAYARIETDGSFVFNNGFTASPAGALYSGGDASALFATTHPLLAGGTEQNTLSTQADLSVTSLQQAIIDIEATVDDRGIICGLRPSNLLIPNELQFTAAEILKSTFVPYSADNEVNALVAKGLQITPWSYITDTDSWYIICDQNKLKWFWRRPLKFYQGNDFENGDAKYKATMRYSAGYSDWRGLYGSQGA